LELSNAQQLRQFGDIGCDPFAPRLVLRALIWPLAFTAMDDAGAAAFGAWPQIKSVSDIAATAIVTDHPWPLNLDSGAVRPYHDVLRSG
jgi:hypothetical protein